MFELFRAGGPLMWIILLCSLVALTIVFERLYALRPSRIVPSNLRDQISDLVKSNLLTHDKIQLVREHSPLGQVYASGLSNISHGTDEMKHALEESGRQVVHRLGRYLNALGTIASITPLIGLLGTVIGMIKVFTAITEHATTLVDLVKTIQSNKPSNSSVSKSRTTTRRKKAPSSNEIK